MRQMVMSIFCQFSLSNSAEDFRRWESFGFSLFSVIENVWIRREESI